MSHERLPLTNWRIVLTRAADQSVALARRLVALGALPLICPAIRCVSLIDSEPLDSALRQLDRYDWVLFTSSNAVRFTVDRLQQVADGLVAMAQQVQIAAIGPGTARILGSYGLPTTVIARDHSGDGLLDALADHIQGPAAEAATRHHLSAGYVTGHQAAAPRDLAALHFLLPTSDLARETIGEVLRSRGAQVDQIVAYRTVPGKGPALLAPILRDGGVDATIFSSPSAVQNLLAGLIHGDGDSGSSGALVALPDSLVRARLGAVICIGPTTAMAAHSAGLLVSAIASEATDDAIIAALLNHYSR